MNLRDNLGYFAHFDHKNLEILLVNDGSTDDTEKVMEEFASDHKKLNVKIITIAEGASRGKKHALQEAIRASTSDYILVTDADCRPSSKLWIREMLVATNSFKNIVLGYGPYEKIQGSFLNKLIRYETVLTAMQYFSYALHGKPYMGVGRNLMYRKDLFEAVEGFQDHLDLRSGDDDLLISQIGNAENTGICDLPSAFMYSKPKTKVTEWIQQKRRHISTAGRYKSSIQVSLVLFYLSQLGFYFLGIALLISGVSWPLLLTFVAVRYATVFAVLAGTCQKLREKDLLAFFPLYEFSVIFMQLYIFVANRISPPTRW